MPPSLATFIYWAFIIFLFRRDFRQRPNVTGALWIPILWMLVICTRSASEWLAIFGFPGLGGSSLEEGSLLDASVYYALIAAGLYVLNKRQVQISEIIRNNQWLTIFFVYCFLAVVWSDFPFVALKRWTKVIGHPIMVLILLTEPEPLEALTRLMKRCAYVIIIISILFIKYYPQWGRGFDEWSGQPFNKGITGGKNALGYDCLILGFFFFWYFLQIWQAERGKARRNELLLIAGILAGIWWLLSMANSSTSFMSLLLGLLTIWLIGLRFVDKRVIGTYIVLVVLAVIVAQSVFGIYDYVLTFLGRNSTLTERTGLWDALLKVKINPVLGTGFESFWLGERRETFWKEIGWQASEAHNGYLETYLSLGLIGLVILLGLIIVTFRKSRLDLLNNFEWGRFRLGFLVAAVAYNWTESGFKSLHPVWFAFYIIALDYPPHQFSPVEESAGALLEEEDTGLVMSEEARLGELIEKEP
jgi:exopolysaccharide production protein ExoQ